MAKQKKVESQVVGGGFLRHIEIKWEKVENRQVFPWSLPIFQNVERLELHPAITIVIGENGMGKSTLVEGIAEAIGINSEGGTRNHSFQTTKHLSPVAPFMRVARGIRREKTEFFLRAESLYNVATSYEKMRDDPFSPETLLHDLHVQSHGESFLKVVLQRFGPHGLYILDEPESALSPQNQLTLLARMRQLINEGSQFIMATHSPMLMAYPGAIIYQLSPNGIEEIDYRESAHFRISKRFVSDPETFLEKLFKEES